MRTPPLPASLPQTSSPQTCRNCGAGLNAALQFCPQCGEPLQKAAARAPLGAVSVVFLVLGLLVFGAVGACGALFSGMTALSLASGTADSEGLSGAFFIIALPCLLIGLTGFIWVLRVLIRGRKRSDSE